MKISELSTDKAMSVLCEITPHVENIISDTELIAELKKAINLDNAETLAAKMAVAAAKITKIIPILLKNRKEDFYGILSALNDKSVEEIAKQNIITTAMQIRDIAKDKELLDFFKSCTSAEGNK
jgi:hypothetical protein